VEPWLRPEQLREGRIWAVFVDEPALKIARMTTVERHGKIVDLSMHHMVGRPGKIEEFVEHHQFSWLSVPLVNDLPQFFGSKGHLNVCLTQRICHSGGNCRSRANRTRLTNSLHTQWVDGRWCHRMVKLEDW
jgi:hypothetical protein